jgi:hypothetical protein
MKEKIDLSNETLNVIASIQSKSMNQVCHRIEALGVVLAQLKEQVEQIEKNTRGSNVVVKE